MIVVTLFITLFAAAFAYLAIMAVRNHHVHNYRQGVLDKISVAAKNDIAEGRFDDWRPRYDAFSSGPSYDEMVKRFWKPLDSFYADKSFME